MSSLGTSVDTPASAPSACVSICAPQLFSSYPPAISARLGHGSPSQPGVEGSGGEKGQIHPASFMLDPRQPLGNRQQAGGGVDTSSKCARAPSDLSLCLPLPVVLDVPSQSAYPPTPASLQCIDRAGREGPSSPSPCYRWSATLIPRSAFPF